MRKKKQEEKKAYPKKDQVIIRRRLTNEPPLDHMDEQIHFLDDCFGENANIEGPLDEAIQTVKKDESRSTVSLASKRNQLHVRKADYKEQVLQVL